MTVTPATCETDGKEERTCACGVKEERPIGALGHDEKNHAAKAPTCTEKGWDAYVTCSRCDHTTYAEKAALDHHYANAWEYSTTAHWHPCTRTGCEEKKDNASHFYDGELDADCNACGAVRVTHCSHPDSSTVKGYAATCITAGKSDGTKCAVCGETLTAQETIPALGHDEQNHTAKTPTCTEKGWDAYVTCSRCSYTTYAEKAALGHNEQNHAAKAPTCTEKGWDAYVACSRCSYTTYAEKAALGHDEQNHTAKAPTCTEKGWDAYVTCSRCSYTTYVEKPAGHQYEITVVAPGTKTEGYTLHACKNCTDSYKTDILPATGKSEGLVYTENADGNSYTLTKIGTCTDTEIYIPAEYNGKKVTAIGEKALAELSGITKIVVGENVKTIDTRAFYACPNLVELTIPASVTSIGNQITYKSNNLTTVYYDSSFVPDSASSFLKQASITHVVFNGTSVPSRILIGCTNIQKVTIGKNVKSINGDYSSYGAFHGCTALTEVVFEENSQLTSIGRDAFYGCTSLTTVTFAEGSQLTRIGSYAFYGCTSLTSIEIPDSVTSIGGYAFRDCTSLASIEIPDSVTSIGGYAFYGCTSLTSIKIPDSVTSISEWAFCECTSLKSIYITDLAAWCAIKVVDSYSNPLHYGADLYIDGKKATDITIPDSVSSIRNYAFYGCTSLASIEIPDSVSSIGDYAFFNCTSLASIEIPDSVTSIGFCTFKDCTSLKSIYITDLAAWCAIKVDGSYSNPLQYRADLYIDGKKATDITIPDSVSSIRNYAFYGCTSLASIEIPDSVSSIGDYAFYDCTSLARIEIPDSVTSIGKSVFSGCTSLESVYIIDLAAWCGIDFDGRISNPLCNGADLYIGGNKATDIVIPDSVSSIRNYAFSGYTSLESIEIPDSVTSIGSSAFRNCISLTSITIPDSVTSIGYDAFFNCTSLESVYIIDLAAWCGIDFDGRISNPLCNGADLYIGGNKATDIVIPDSVSSIRNYAFSGYTSLESIEIPDSVTSIGSSAFRDCTSLKRIDYAGTTAQWNTIEKGNNWNYNVTGCTVYCRMVQ